MSNKPNTGSQAAAERERVELHKGGIAVFADPRKRVHAGIRAHGRMKVGVEHVVAPDEALRLVQHKHFDYASPADKRAAEAHAARKSEDEAKATAQAEAEAKATTNNREQ